MNANAEIGTPQENSEDFDYGAGFVTAEFNGDDGIVIRFYKDGEQVALASVSAYGAGILTGILASAAGELAGATT